MKLSKRYLKQEKQACPAFTKCSDERLGSSIMCGTAIPSEGPAHQETDR